jgi:FAD synthase
MWYIIITILLIILIIVKLNHTIGPWEHSGKVVKGVGVSKKIDWKTANLSKCPDKINENGFYSCTTNYGEGTLLKGPQNICEVHIHNFDNDIYGKSLKLRNIRKIDLPFKIVSTDGTQYGV